jgi:hypothetical protein
VRRARLLLCAPLWSPHRPTCYATTCTTARSTTVSGH